MEENISSWSFSFLPTWTRESLLPHQFTWLYWLHSFSIKLWKTTQKMPLTSRQNKKLCFWKGCVLLRIRTYVIFFYITANITLPPQPYVALCISIPTVKRDVYSNFNFLWNEDILIIDSKEDIAPSTLRKENMKSEI